METDLLQKEKATRLFTYLKELSSLKSPLVRDIKQYENFILLDEIPNEPECVSPLFTEIKDTWLEIKKPSKPTFPNPTEVILPWLLPHLNLRILNRNQHY